MTEFNKIALSYSVPSVNSLGSYRAFVKNIPNLSSEEEIELFNKFKSFNSLESVEKLVLSQMKNVFWIADQFKGYGLPEEDLVQEGTIGLMKAVKSYNLSFKVRLYTYAIVWIKSEIQSYIIKNWKIVKIATTNNLKKLFFNFKTLQKEFLNNKINDKSLIESIAKKLAVNAEDVQNIKDYFDGGDIEIDSLINEDGENFYYIKDENTPELLLENKMTEENNTKNLKLALTELNQREREIIEFKFFKEDKLTNKEIASILNISSERVRQIEKIALDKMKKVIDI